MGYDELQQFIKIPVEGLDEFSFQPMEDDEVVRSRLNSMNSEVTSSWQKLEEEERIYGVVALYTDQVVNLNMRRRITYTDKLLGTVFDGACVCVSYRNL